MQSLPLAPAASRPRSGWLPPAAVQAALLLFMVIYYAAALSRARFDPFAPVGFGLTFNSMLEHLLNGQFDVDPATVGLEGFARQGHVYAYWGIWCALLRLPLLAIPGGMQHDVTAISCLVAITLAGFVKIRALFVLRAMSPASRFGNLLFVCMVSYIVLGGAEISNLIPTIYTEVVFWAYAWATLFVYCALLGLVHGWFSTGRLAAMAAFSGLALLTRVSTATGLYAALGMLTLVLIVQTRRWPIVAVAWLILTLFAAVTGFVNFERWGNPLLFQDLQSYLYVQMHPDRLARFTAYGLFSLARLPYGLLYYFLPIWGLPGADGQTLLAPAELRLFDALEMPPSSFLLTDLLPIGLAVACLWRVLRRARLVAVWPTLALLAGLLIPWALMLSAWTLAQRYRMEFYPALDLLALLAFHVFSARPPAWPRFRNAVIGATLISIAGAHASLFLYELSDLGDAHPRFEQGAVSYYRSKLAKGLGKPSL